MKLSHIEFIKTSLPFTFSTMAASLMGAVDTAVVGHLGNYTYINAVSLGAVIFSTVYWLFGFLKISTSGFAAQALGQHDPKLLAGAFIRGVLAAFGIGLLLVILQEPIWRTALLLFNPDAATRPMLEQYYRMLIWIMPLTLVFQTARDGSPVHCMYVSRYSPHLPATSSTCCWTYFLSLYCTMR